MGVVRVEWAESGWNGGVRVEGWRQCTMGEVREKSGGNQRRS